MIEQPEAQGKAEGQSFKAGENVYAGMVVGAHVDDQQAPGEEKIGSDGLRSAESKSEKTLERGDVEAILRQAGELNGISEVQYGLERSIIGGGLQTMADRYGADKLLDALQSSNLGSTTITAVAEVLAPDKNERKALYAAIEQEPMDALGDRLNETVGGVASLGNVRTDNLARYRREDMKYIKEGKRTEGAGLLITGNFDNLLKDHPQLVENFRQSNDTLVLLKDIGAVYDSEHAKFTSDLERTKSQIDEMVAKGEAGVAELRNLSDEIYSDEVTGLEERLQASTNKEAQAMIQALLDQRIAEAKSTREEFVQKSEAVRTKIVSDLGADNLSMLRLPAPVEPRPTYRPHSEQEA